MRKAGLLLAFLAALLAAPVFPGAAGAHVEMTPSEVPAGKPANLSFEIPHGCDGAATTSILVQIPKGAENVTATAVKGWKATTAPDTLTWSGGPLPDHETAAFPFRATLYGKKGEAFAFKVIQKCQGGAQTAWIQSAAGGVEPEHPAPTVTLASTAAEPAAEVQATDDQVADEDATQVGEPTATAADPDDSSDDDNGEGNGKTVLLLVVAGLAIGTVAGIVIRARRSP
ncbi:MAG: YcnI family protein [Solirubrobacterales bacterium]|nr:YcnI family protein [Solirubrobacterales bacterium]OJU94113.1 MAG: hypothetical protein BGO23_00050 [Solirubrobacterales bacterium 67-14]